jgi:hypothetical protein
MDSAWQGARESLGEEATWVGLIGAAVVAVWFLILDLIAGHPLRTPSVLGQVLLLGRENPDVIGTDFTGVILYTALHMGLFLAFGFALAYIIRWSVDNHFVRYAVLQVFLAFELFFVFVVLMLNEETRSLFPVWTVLAANTLAALCMGLYLWRNHPDLQRELRETPLGAAPLA